MPTYRKQPFVCSNLIRSTRFRKNSFIYIGWKKEEEERKKTLIGLDSSSCNHSESRFAHCYSFANVPDAIVTKNYAQDFCACIWKISTSCSSFSRRIRSIWIITNFSDELISKIIIIIIRADSNRREHE